MEFLTNDKLTIVGAAGMIGSNMAQTAIMMHLTPNLCLYDPYAPGLEGVAEELFHCGFEGMNITFTSDIKEALTGAKYVVSSGGAARKAGMTREDLLKGNAAIAEEFGKNVKAYCPDVKHVVVIFNPADITGLITLLYSGLKPSQVTTLAALDSTRLRSELSKHFGIAPDKIENCRTYGGHGEQMAVYASTAKVDGKTVAAGNARLMAKLGLTAPEVTEPGTLVHVAIEGQYAGYLLIADVVKPHSAQAIRSLKSAGVRKTVMLTGDAEPVARAVANQLGLDEYHAGLLPGDKVDQIETLLAAKQPKENLAFVGDGITDAPVLSRADVGIAMGALGSDAAIEAADVVLMDDDPAKIALAMRIARRTKSIVYQNIVFALAIKAACLLLGALGIANMWAAIFADVGVMVLAVLNATRALYTKNLIQK